jgi:DNA-binding response OmpR family regulator
VTLMTEPTHTPKMVLIVEDEEPIAIALAMIVEDAGFTVACASNGRIALTLIHQQQPDLIFTDLMMPQLSGQELVAYLRANGFTDLRIVVMSAIEKAHMRVPGADALLPKPFSLEEVDAILREFLG